jgi:hypothetical protein
VPPAITEVAQGLEAGSDPRDYLPQPDSTLVASAELISCHPGSPAQPRGRNPNCGRTLGGRSWESSSWRPHCGHCAGSDRPLRRFMRHGCISEETGDRFRHLPQSAVGCPSRCCLKPWIARRLIPAAYFEK